jgi:hypothetical protein
MCYKISNQTKPKRNVFKQSKLKQKNRKRKKKKKNKTGQPLGQPGKDQPSSGLAN